MRKTLEQIYYRNVIPTVNFYVVMRAKELKITNTKLMKESKEMA